MEQPALRPWPEQPWMEQLVPRPCWCRARTSQQAPRPKTTASVEQVEGHLSPGQLGGGPGAHDGIVPAYASEPQ